MIVPFTSKTYEVALISCHVSTFFLQIGNALVCLAVYTNHSMRTVTNIFIVNLAVADFFVILLCLPPTVVWDVTETWFLGEVLCKVVIYFQVCDFLCTHSPLLSFRSLIMLTLLFMRVFVYSTKITTSCSISLAKSLAHKVNAEEKNMSRSWLGNVQLKYANSINRCGSSSENI